MPTVAEIRAAANARGRVVQLTNALTAILFAGLFAVVLAEIFLPTAISLWAGFFVGLLYANAYEYFFHRFLLHWPGTFLTERHLEHHRTVGAPDEGRYINFLGSPLLVMAVFVVNAMPFLALEWWLQPRIVSGVLVGFIVYFILSEEIHRRIHLGGWLPSWLESARYHHLQHHDQPDGRFNVFFPLFDRLLGGQSQSAGSADATRSGHWSG